MCRVLAVSSDQQNWEKERFLFLHGSFQKACSAPEIIGVSASKASKYTVFIQDCKKLSCFFSINMPPVCLLLASLVTSDTGLSCLDLQHIADAAQDLVFFKLFKTVILNSRTLISVLATSSFKTYYFNKK